MKQSIHRIFLTGLFLSAAPLADAVSAPPPAPAAENEPSITSVFPHIRLPNPSEIGPIGANIGETEFVITSPGHKVVFYADDPLLTIVAILDHLRLKQLKSPDASIKLTPDEYNLVKRYVAPFYMGRRAVLEKDRTIASFFGPGSIGERAAVDIEKHDYAGFDPETGTHENYRHWTGLEDYFPYDKFSTDITSKVEKEEKERAALVKQQKELETKLEIQRKRLPTIKLIEDILSSDNGLEKNDAMAADLMTVLLRYKQK